MNQTISINGEKKTCLGYLCLLPQGGKKLQTEINVVKSKGVKPTHAHIRSKYIKVNL